MYHNQYTLNGGNIMTIKRRIFISNIRMAVISVISVALILRLPMIFGRRSPGEDRTYMQQYFDTQHIDPRMLFILISLLLSLVIISLINNFLTLRMTRQIIKPLEPLNEGIQQIEANNLAFRINYKVNDEFRPVCEAFNGMVARLETSAAQKIKDEANRKELIAGISHDLRTPLTSILGCAEGIEAGVATTLEKQKFYIANIRNEAIHMKHMIEQLFLFSKLDMDEFPLNSMRVDISLAISEMIEDSLDTYKSKGLSIIFREMQKDKFVFADVFLLRNVLTNIIENSIKYKTKELGRMEISAVIEDNQIMIYFADDGPGIDADILPKLFDVFYRADPSRSKMGSGLGLAISEKIIQSMGGNILAELSSQGGLAIVIKLPLMQDKEL
jgi:signal transduction histidine kinase